MHSLFKLSIDMIFKFRDSILLVFSRRLIIRIRPRKDQVLNGELIVRDNYSIRGTNGGFLFEDRTEISRRVTENLIVKDQFGLNRKT